MSHYTVTIRLSKNLLEEHEGDVQEALGEILAPFEESTEDMRFRLFKDCEDDARIEYWESREHQAKYKTFDKYATEYHGYKKHEGRYGYWHNPNAKWDWWIVGGRWTGFYPLANGAQPKLGLSGSFGNEPEKGRGDVVTLAEIDVPKIAKETIEAAEKFWQKYQTWLNDPKVFRNEWDGPRHKALDLGLVVVEKKKVESTETTKAISWADSIEDPQDVRRGWTDVAKLISREEFFAKYMDCFNPIVTYASLDAEGWHSPGEMGWFGCSTDTPDQKIEFCKAFVSRFLTGHEDTLVVVDCHI